MNRTPKIVRQDLDYGLTLELRGSMVTFEAGLLAYRELDDALALTDMAGEMPLAPAKMAALI